MASQASKRKSFDPPNNSDTEDDDSDYAGGI